MPRPLDAAVRAIIDRLDAPELTLDALLVRLEAAGVAVSRSTLYRYRKARPAAPVPAAPSSVAARVAALAPPPAVPAEPPADLGDGSPAAVIEVLSRSHRELLDGAARAKATNDLDAFARLHRTAGDLLSQIRQIQKAVAAQGVGGRHYTDDEIAKARDEVRRRMTEIALGRGEELTPWDLGAQISEADGGPKVSRP